jgi:hypothetical protein
VHPDVIRPSHFLLTQKDATRPMLDGSASQSPCTKAIDCSCWTLFCSWLNPDPTPVPSFLPSSSVPNNNVLLLGALPPTPRSTIAQCSSQCTPPSQHYLSLALLFLCCRRLDPPTLSAHPPRSYAAHPKRVYTLVIPSISTSFYPSFSVSPTCPLDTFLASLFGRSFFLCTLSCLA